MSTRLATRVPSGFEAGRGGCEHRLELVVGEFLEPLQVFAVKGIDALVVQRLFSSCRGLIASPVFGRHIVLRDFFGMNFSLVRVGCIFHAADHFGLEGLSLLDQF